MQKKPDSEHLAARLRALRYSAGLTQAQLADTLSARERLSASTVSTWESGALPPKHRLISYALLFSGDRFATAGHPRLPGADELDDDEKIRMGKLKDELLGLREADARIQRELSHERLPDVWHFPDEAPVTIVCPDLPEDGLSRYARRDDLNFVRMLSLGDGDSVVDIYGEVRARNPNSIVRIRGASALQDDELVDHLVVVGGIAFNSQMQWYIELLRDLKIRQVSVDPSKDSRHAFEPIVAFEKGQWRQFEPTFGTREGRDILLSDVGSFVRIVNPHNRLRTLTLCNGVYTSGVRGAAQCFIDRGLRTSNLEYLAAHCDDVRHFGLVLSVRVREAVATTPNRWEKGSVLFSLPAEGADEEAAEDHAAVPV